MRPRIRSLKPELWQDEKIGDLSLGARLLFVGLITMADDEGRFRATASVIVGHVFPYDDEAPRRLKGWVAEIKDSGLVVFYVVDGKPYGAFRHWKRHQRVNRPTDSTLPPPPDPGVVTDNSVNDHDSLTDSSVNSHDQITESSVIAHSPTRRRAFRSDPDPVVVGLSEKLAARVRANDPKANPDPHSDRWLTEMRLLVADRGGDVAEVERIIDWCQADSFWHTNILSPAKLRKQFTQLVLKAKPSGQVVSIGRRENASDWLREMEGEGVA